MAVQLKPAFTNFVFALREINTSIQAFLDPYLCNEYVLLQVEVEMDRKPIVSEMLEWKVRLSDSEMQLVSEASSLRFAVRDRGKAVSWFPQKGSPIDAFLTKFSKRSFDGSISVYLEYGLSEPPH
jgi:hypothetical protein